VAIPSFKESHLRNLCEILVDAYSHKELTDLFRQCHIEENGGTPKWERLLFALSKRQSTDQCGNNVGTFIEAALDPARFTLRAEAHPDIVNKVNRILAFSGLHILDSGKLGTTEKASTLTEAQQRADRLKQNLQARNVHPDVISFCKAELVQDNYFHAVLETTKSVSEKIRQKADVSLDGIELIDSVFGGNNPILALNSLQTKSEKSEQKGFVNLLKGLFGTFRNPTAHSPKIFWSIDERDALDLLTMASYFHRRVDSAVRAKWGQ